MDLICLGELLVDMFPVEIGRPLTEVTALKPTPGGAMANAAVAASRLGYSSAFIGKVGDDPYGHWLESILVHEGVNVQGLRFDPDARTTMVLLSQPDPNSYECVFYRNPGADTRLEPAELDSSLIHSARVFHFGSLSLTDEPSRSATSSAIEIARQAGSLISYDVNYRPTFWPSPAAARSMALEFAARSDLVKVNETEMELLGRGQKPETTAAMLFELGPSVVVLTRGSGGSQFFSPQGAGLVPAYPVETVDATGCGDAFMAGLLCRLVSGSNWRAELDPERLTGHMRYANAVAALTALRQGVIPALPTLEQVQTFLGSHDV